MTEILRLAGKLSVSGSCGSGSSSSTITASSNSSKCNTHDCEYSPPLTAAECTLLMKHARYFKCHKFYAGHRQSQCTKALLQMADYRELTEDDANKAKRNFAAAVECQSPVACGVLEYSSDSDYTGCIVATTSTSPTSLAKPAPYVPDTTAKPLSLPHFTFRAIVHDSSGPCHDTSVCMLIDCGSSTALICSDVVQCFNLRTRLLPTPIPLNSAWGSKGTTATRFIKLHIFTRSLAWTSSSCHVLVVDDLCAPVILGQTFLAFNHLILDCAARSCKDKRNNFDLLNSTSSPFLKEEPVPVSPVRQLELRPTIAAIRETIERLTLNSRLKSEESTMRKWYTDVFPSGTPKLVDLPTDVYHRFKLKDPNLVIARRSYDCPKKYREAWK
ncbi:hypothetical protein BDY19DRAFT_890949, partial [Irpex rosettiformis]